LLLRSPVEIGARIVVMAGGTALGTMAKAGHPNGMDRLNDGKGVERVPCVIQSPDRVSDNLREAGTGRRHRLASNATAAPRTIGGTWSAVHGLFLRALALALFVGVAFGAVFGNVSVTANVEIGARIVVMAGGTALGTMAKAGHPNGMDRLLNTAGHDD
jgi:hypothetical protein